MSLDICGTIDTGGKKPVEIWSFNITHNLALMCRWAGCYDALYESYGKVANDIIAPIEAAIVKLEAEPDGASQFSASNGWGTYEQALPWLRELLAALKAHPKTTIAVYR